MTESRLKRLAGWLYGATLASQIVLPLTIAFVFVSLALGSTFAELPEGSVATGAPLWLGIAVGLSPALALFWALDLLRRLFQLYKEGEVLSERAALLIRRIGKAMLILAVLKITAHPLKTLLLTWQSPPGSRMIAVSIGQAEVGFLLLAGLLTVIGWAMTEAARMAEENRSFV